MGVRDSGRRPKPGSDTGTQIIPLIDPSTDGGFRSSTDARFDDRFGRSGVAPVARRDARQPGPAGTPRRWIVPAALGVIVVIVVVAGAVASGPGTAPRTAPTTPPTTTAPGTSGAPPPTRPPGTPGEPGPLPLLSLVPATPDDYLVDDVLDGVGAGSAGAGSAEAGSVTELWASEVNAMSGPWFTVTVSPFGSGELSFVAGDRRVATNLGVAVLNHVDTRVTVLEAPIEGGRIHVVAAGIDDGSVLRLAATTSLATTRSLVHSADPRSARFTLVASTSDDPAGAQVSGPKERRTTYRTAAPVNGVVLGFSVSTIAAPTESAQRMRSFFLSRSETVDLGGGPSEGQRPVIGVDSRSGDPSMVSLVVERTGRWVEISGNAPRDVLVAAARSLHPADDVEWAALRLASRRNQDAFVADPVAEAPTARFQVNAGTLADGSPWAVGISVAAGATAPAAGIIYSESGIDRFPLTRGRPSITLRATVKATGVIALISRLDVGARLRITIGGKILDLDATDAQPGLDALVAGYVFDSLDPYLAQIVTADGTVLASAGG